MAYVTPRNFYRGRKAKLRLIVMHTMESPEHDDTAENVAAWFAGANAPLASAHACVDNNSVVLCLPPSDTAWAAPGANADGYQIEQAGRAAQGIAGWADAYSQSMLRLSAAHARSIAQAAGIPLVHLTDAQLAAGAAGFVGHDQVSRVYKRSDHTDPGPDFPWTQYMALVNGGSAPDSPATPTTQKEIPEMVIIKSANRKAALIGPASFHAFRNSEEQATAIAVLAPAIKDNISDRQYDVIRAVIAAGALDATQTRADLATLLADLDEEA